MQPEHLHAAVLLRMRENHARAELRRRYRNAQRSGHMIGSWRALRVAMRWLADRADGSLRGPSRPRQSTWQSSAPSGPRHVLDRQ